MLAITILERKGKEMEVGHDEVEADRNLTIASSTALSFALLPICVSKFPT